MSLACGGMVLVVTCLIPHLSITNLPLNLIFGPVFIVPPLLFFGVAAVLRRRGIAVFVSEIEEVKQAKMDRDDLNQPMKL